MKLPPAIAETNAENNLGWLLLRQGQLEKAEPYLRSSLNRFETAGVEHKRSHVLLSLGELALERGNPEDAKSHIATGIQLAEKTGEAANAGYGYELVARIAVAAGDRHGADQAFETAIQLLDKVGASERLIEVRSNYARALEERGEDKRALEQWKAAMAVSHPQSAVRQEPDRRRAASK